MRYALLSDIHANLPALEAVLEDLRGRTEVDAVYHLGDLVGYAPWPNEVVALLARAGIRGVAGNYDSTVATDYKHCGCRSEDPMQEALSHASYAWTLAHVSAETKVALGALPFRIDRLPLGGHLAGPRLVLVLLDIGAGLVRVEIVRVAYDVERAARGVLESELPDALADHLRQGARPPS